MSEKRKQERNLIKIDFLSKAKYFAVFSVLLTLVSVGEVIIDGFNFGIDFAGGTEVQVQFNEAGSGVSAGEVRAFTDKMELTGASVQAFGDAGDEYLIRMDSIKGENDKETNKLLNAMITKLTEGLKTEFAAQGALIRRVDSVGPQVGDELKRNGLLAVFYCLLMILIYIGLRFDYKYAPSAVFCLFHDAIITLGIFAIFEFEVNVQTLAAILTIIGYSLNDTIVTFDRIRENVPVYREKSFYWVVNRALNDVLSRTLLTSITTMLAVIAMYALAGGVIRDFAFTLGIGILIGTYSSIYVASPLVIFIDKLQRNRAAAA